MATMTKRNPIKALLIKVRSEAERAARKLGLTGNIVAAADAEIEFWASYANDGKVDTWRDSFPAPIASRIKSLYAIGDLLDSSTEAGAVDEAARLIDDAVTALRRELPKAASTIDPRSLVARAAA